MVVYEEIKGDLFNATSTTSLAHCVSEDLAMSKGIAAIFKQKFGGLEQLKQQGITTGDVAILDKGTRFIYYLVTKARYFNKPTYVSLESSLIMMRQHCVENNIKDLAMPKIGCGLDRLEWSKVKDIILSVFGNTAIKIKIYTL